MNKNSPLNQRYICPIGADGIHIAPVTDNTANTQATPKRNGPRMLNTEYTRRNLLLQTSLEKPNFLPAFSLGRIRLEKSPPGVYGAISFLGCDSYLSVRDIIHFLTGYVFALSARRFSGSAS